MFKNIPLMRIVPLIVVIFLISGLIQKDSMMDILRFLLSLSAYSAGIFLILWALTRGGAKKASPKDRENKREK